jgi:flavin reductase (DIM6/NTAB) family NADH-FMN oxidoreductase RutF/rubredoxin
MKYEAFHKLSYGLYIVASAHEGKKAGYIGNTVFQVTAEPSQLAISCHKNNSTCGIIENSKVFSVSVLQKELDTSIIGIFGFMTSSEIDKFSNIKHQVFSTGAPIVTESTVAWFECKVVNQIDTGTHILFIGEVVDGDVLSENEPLTYQYYREKYRMLAPKNAPTYIEKEKLSNETLQKIQTEKSVMLVEEEKRDLGEDYSCTICGYTYNPADGEPAAGIPPGTRFEDLPDDFKCPVCGASKEYFHG